MGLFDSITPAAGDAKGGGIMESIMSLVGGQGGLGGLVEKFTAGGLGDTISSWISTGANKSVSPDQIKSVLGSDKLNEIAKQTGLSVEEVTNQVAKNLPNVVDKLTPDGKIPEGNILEKGMEMLKGLF